MGKPKATTTRFEVANSGGRTATVYLRGMTWWADFWDGSVRVRASLKTRNKGVASELAQERLRRADRKAAGDEDPFEEHRARPLADHLADFEASGFRGKTKPERCEEVMRSLRAFVEGSGARRLRDLTETAAKRWLEVEREKPEIEGGQPLSVRSLNRHRQALKQLGRWLVRDRRAVYNPFVGLVLEDHEADRRYVRGALESQEVAKLADTTLGRGELQRAACYLLAVGSGLRRKELRQLRCGDLDLDAESTVTIRAATAKNSRREVLPLHGLALELLRELRDRRLRGDRTSVRSRDRLKGWDWDSPVFDAIPSKATLASDLKAAGIDPGTSNPDDGERDVVDFHALRCTLATWCAREGVSLQMAAKLMRHSDPRLTLRVYTRLTTADKRAAVDKLRLPKSVTVSVTGDEHDGAQRCAYDASARAKRSTGSGTQTPAVVGSRPPRRGARAVEWAGFENQ